MSSDRRRPSCISAFTLIELLVVIAIIAVLAAMLFPGLSAAKYEGKNAVCKNNLRQISIAVHSYASGNDVFPPDYAGSSTPETDPRRFRWESTIAPEVPEIWISGGSGVNEAPQPRPVKGGIFQCPINHTWRITGTDGEYTFLMWNSYGYNAWGTAPDGYLLGLGGANYRVDPFAIAPFRFTRETAVARPSEMIAFGDTFLRSRNAQADGAPTITCWSGSEAGTLIAPSASLGVGVWGVPTQTIKPKQQPNFRAHHGRANRDFADGHIESEDVRPNFRATDAQLSRWNIDNLPHREHLQD